MLCKVFEKLVKDEMGVHAGTNGLLKGTQHGFRKGWSCLTNLLTFLDRVTEELDNGRLLSNKLFKKLSQKLLAVRKHETNKRWHEQKFTEC